MCLYPLCYNVPLPSLLQCAFTLSATMYLYSLCYNVPLPSLLQCAFTLSATICLYPLCYNVLLPSLLQCAFTLSANAFSYISALCVRSANVAEGMRRLIPQDTDSLKTVIWFILECQCDKSKTAKSCVKLKKERRI
jgi:hypothetical protein